MVKPDLKKRGSLRTVYDGRYKFTRYFAAASVTVSAPLMAVFWYAQRFFKSGLTIGSVKG